MIGLVSTRNERGAALIIVLLLVATLSLVVLSVTERMAFAAHRGINAQARSEAMWRAIGVEALAAAALISATSDTTVPMTADSPWVERPITAPMEGGAATLWFSDATRCFNLNSLVNAPDDGRYEAREAGIAELAATLEAAGAPPGATDGLGAVVADWIDHDTLNEAQGAEDSFYTALPTPYRTSGALLADETELRAMADVDRELFDSLRPFVCVHPTPEPSVININMLTQADAPVLAGLVGGKITEAQAKDIISDRPPGGYVSVDDFWAHPTFAGLELDQPTRDRARLRSRYVEARADIAYEGAVINARLVYQLGEAGSARLISRRWGLTE